MSKLFHELEATTKALRECQETGGHDLQFLRDTTDYRVEECTKCKTRFMIPHGQ